MTEPTEREFLEGLRYEDKFPDEPDVERDTADLHLRESALLNTHPNTEGRHG